MVQIICDATTVTALYWSCPLHVSLTVGHAGQWQEGDGYERPHVLVTSPGSPERPRPTPAPSVGGRIQIRLGFDPTTLQLLVTIVCAAGLTPRSPQQPRNPYCKLFLLPDRSEKSKRRTRTLAGNNFVCFWCPRFCLLVKPLTYVRVHEQSTESIMILCISLQYVASAWIFNSFNVLV